MNQYQIWMGDCLKLMPQIPDKSVDMILCDPPYGTTACKWDIVIPFEPLWEQYKRIIKTGGAILLFGSEPFSSYLRLSNLKNYKYDWYWNKGKPSNYMMAKKEAMRVIETISVFNAKFYYPIMENKTGNTEYHEKYYNGNLTNNKDGVYGDRTSMTVQYSKDYDSTKKYPVNYRYFTIRETWSKTKLRSHPSEKPVSLLEYLIKTYTLEGELVLDNTMGSGSTGVACLNTQRKFIGIEKDESYFEIAKKRIEELL